MTIQKRLFSSARTLAKDVNNLTVIGGGQMGLGIALVAANKAGVNVKLVDTSDAALDKGMAFLQKLLSKDIKKGRLTEEQAKDITARVTPTTDLTGALKDTDMVIEAVPEIPDLKFKIFSQLAKEAPADAILATNTSSISITKIAAAAKGAENRVVAAHFMNPVPVQPGVEIIQALQTDKSIVDDTLAFVGRMGKVPSLAKDSPGFIANRILVPYINEAVIVLESGIGSAKDIDAMMVNGCAMPMGPLALADFIGLDTCFAIMNVLYKDTGDSKYRPSVLLGKMVDAGWLGKKSGKGFYEYK